MPTRGYRKGHSDTKVPLPRQVYFRTTDETYSRIVADAQQRQIHLSEELREIVDAFLDKRRVALPHPKAPNQNVIYELARIGNNLNQLAHQANLMRLHHLESQARDVLSELNAVIKRL